MTEEQKVEELLAIRWIVIADFPANTRKVGSIIYGLDDKKDQAELERQMALYPHLFRKLSWWEERSIEEMPEYVKRIKIGFGIVAVYKVREWEKDFAVITTKRHIALEIEGNEIVEPATLSEYLQYQTINSK